MGKQTVLIADDEAHVRQVMRTIVATISDLEVIAECDNGEDALTQIRLLGPDITLLDINMPKKNGVDVLKEIKNAGSPTRVIMITSLNDMDSVRQCLSAGAINYLLKSNSPDKIRRVLEKLVTDHVDA